MLLEAAVLRTMQPILQGLIVKYFSTEDPSNIPTRNEALYYATGLVLATVAIAFIVQHMFLDSQQIGMRIRIACSSLIYRKVRLLLLIYRKVFFFFFL